MATEIASLYARIGADISAFQREMGKVSKDLDDNAKRTKALGDSMKMAFGIGAAAVGALAVGIGASVKSAASMEQQIANIAAVMGLTSEETEQLDGLIKDLGLDPNLKVSAVEAADAIGMLGRNGLSMTEIMDGAARSTVLLANSTGADFATAADLATDVMALFNIDAENMTKAVDGITGVVTNSKFSIDDYRLAIAQGGGVAASTGVQFEDFNAVIAAISPLFASGSDAGTSFKTFLQRLVPQTEAAEVMMQQLGLSFFDATGAMLPMEEIAGQLNRAFADLTEEQKINAASTMFGTDAMRAAFGLASAGREDILRLKAAIGDVSAEEAAATRMNTFAGALEIFQGVIESLSIEMGTAFLPHLTKLVQFLTDIVSTYGTPIVEWANQFSEAVKFLGLYLSTAMESGDRMNDWLGNLPESWKNNIDRIWEFVDAAQAMWSKIVEVGNVVKEALKPFGDMITRIISWKDVVGALAVFIGGPLLMALAGWVAAMAPILVQIAAVVAAVRAARWAWEQDLFGIRTAVGNAVTKISEWWDKHAKALTTTTTSIRTILGQEVQYTLPLFVSQWLGKMATWSRTTISIAQRMFGDFVLGVTRWKDESIWAVQAWIWDFRREYVDAVEKWLAQGIQHFKDAWWRIYNDTGLFLRDFLREWDKFREKWLSWFQPREWIDAGRDLIQGFWDGVSERWRSFWSWIQGKWEELSSGFKRFFGIRSPSKLFAGYGSDIAEGLAIGMERAMPQVDAAVMGMAGTVDGTGSMMGPGPMDNGDSDLAAAIRALIAVLQQQRGGNQISVTMPQASGNSRSDLAATVQYLQALYA